MDYKDLNIYEATYEEVYEAVKQQYKNREHTDIKGNKLTIKDWNGINKDIKERLTEMGVKFKNAFYNPNNDRVYIKQKFWTVTGNFWDKFTEQEKQYEIEHYGSEQKAIKAWNETELNSCLQYIQATGEDYFYTEEDYFDIPAW